MNYLAQYWYQKIEDTKDDRSITNRLEQIYVRKMLIVRLMDYPISELSFFLKRDPWLRTFTLEDTDPIDHSQCVSENIETVVNQWLEKYFYAKDYEVIHKILEQYGTKVPVVENESMLSMIKRSIEALLKRVEYAYLSSADKEQVDILEKVYFDHLELLNPYIKDKAGNEVYYTVLMEQWKTANDMAANISSQRNTMNNFYMSLMSILVGGILFSDQVFNTNPIAKSVLFLAIAVIGVVCCHKWLRQIENYGRLNGVKYEVINELERQLPANVMMYEYIKSEKNARKEKNKVLFSKQEMGIAKLFQYVIICVSLIMLIATWW